MRISPQQELQNVRAITDGLFHVLHPDSFYERPIPELRRLFSLHRELFGVTPREDWLDVDDTVARELRDRLTSLGYDGELERAFADWAGAANLEERVDGLARIDPIVLAALRKESA